MTEIGRDTRFKRGHNLGFRKGASGNPGGVSKLQREYKAYQMRLFEPEVKERAWACLKTAIDRNERWAVERWFDMVERILPQQPVSVNVNADLTLARKEFDAQFQLISDVIGRYAATCGAAEAAGEVISGHTPLQLAAVGETESTGASTTVDDVALLGRAGLRKNQDG